MSETSWAVGRTVFGPQLQQEAVASLGADDAAGVRSGFQNDDLGATAGQGVRRGQAREPGPDDYGPAAHSAQKPSAERARSASARRKVGRSFRPGVRRKCAMPASRASCAKSWSISWRVSTWSVTKAIGTTRTCLTGRAAELAEHLQGRRAEPLHGSELGLVRERHRTAPGEALADRAHARLHFGRIGVAFAGHQLFGNGMRREEQVRGLARGGRETSRAPRGWTRRGPPRTADGSARTRARPRGPRKRRDGRRPGSAAEPPWSWSRSIGDRGETPGTAGRPAPRGPARRPRPAAPSRSSPSAREPVDPMRSAAARYPGPAPRSGGGSASRPRSMRRASGTPSCGPARSTPRSPCARAPAGRGSRRDPRRAGRENRERPPASRARRAAETGSLDLVPETSAGLDSELSLRCRAASRGPSRIVVARHRYSVLE